MSEPILFTLGLPFGQWSGVAARMLAGGAPSSSSMDKFHDELFQAPPLSLFSVSRGEALLGARLTPEKLRDAILAAVGDRSTVGIVDARLCWSSLAIAEALPQARFLVWVEHPVQALANWLQSSPSGSDPVAVLALLRSAMQSILQLVHKHNGRCLVVELGEARGKPDALADSLTRRLSWSVQLTASDAPCIDELTLVLADRWAAADVELARVHQRLYASCVLLGDQESEQPSAPDVSSVALDAVRKYLDTARRAVTAAQLKEQLRHAKEDVSRVKEMWADAVRDKQQTAAKLQQIDEELNATFLQWRHSEDELAMARSDAQLAYADAKSLREAHATLQVERDALSAELVQVHRQSASTRLSFGKIHAALGTAQAERTQVVEQGEGLQQQVVTMSRQNELLRVQLQQVHEEMRQYYLACKEFEGMAQLTRDPANMVRVGRIETLDVRNDPPHRELALTLRGVKALDRVCQQLAVRLVEHNGRSGLVFLEMDEGAKPLMSWEPTGQEQERSFVLLVPEDQPSRERLQYMGAGDWRFVQGVAACLAHSLADAKSETSQRWAVVARKLVKNLADLPVRFRFDGVDIQPDAELPGTFVVSFHSVVFGEYECATLRLRWRPSEGGSATLELQAPEGPHAMPLLGAWPLEEGGTWATRWTIPFGSDPAGKSAWRVMSRPDREILLGLLDALPAAARRAAELGLVAPGSAEELTASAARTLHQASRLLYGTRLRRIWRAARGKVTAL